MNKKGSVLVVFGGEIPKSLDRGKYDEVIAAKDFVMPGSIYEATEFVESLSKIEAPGGKVLPKLFLYKGYELWWIHYNDLFYYFGLPFTQYKNLLDKIKNFETVTLYNVPFKHLFEYFLLAHNCKVNTSSRERKYRILPFGIFLQLLLNFLFIPILLIKRPEFLLFIGDKLEKGKDFDFRMKFVYKELRERGVRSVEFIRSLESWQKLVGHSIIRRRPVVYSEALVFFSKLISYLQRKKPFPIKDYLSADNPDTRFRLLVGTNYLRSIYVDIWTIRISKLIIKIIGVKAAYFSAALDRNYPAVLACKLNNIPTAGILHGAASKYYNGYDFLPGFSGEKILSLDKYGVWSDWWKAYYLKYGDAYKSDQLVVSGPMRPVEKDKGVTSRNIEKSAPVRVLFVSEQLAVPEEVLPYIEILLDQPDIDVTFTFRQFGDGFKEWLYENKPGFFDNPRIKIAEGSLVNAIEETEVAVGSHSTAVLEMLLKEKAPLFFQTKKWGDYYNLKEYNADDTFFAENPEELVKKIKNIRSVPKETLIDLQKRYFGDIHKNGSKWLVEHLLSTFS